MLDEANFYYEVFSNIAREARVKEYYIQCHKVGDCVTVHMYMY